MRLSRIGFVVLLASFLSAGCGWKLAESGNLSEQGGKASPQGTTLAGSMLPATYAGVLPCAELENTYWKLVRLGDQPVIVSSGRREPHLRLVSEGRKAQGFAGCNRLLGAYELEGQTLRFAHLATTRMACPDGMEPEHIFLSALESTARWNILGEHLELYDSGGTLLARFEARTMK